MNTMIHFLVGAVSLSVGAAPCLAQNRITLTFDDLVAFPDPGFQPVGEQYARFGVHFGTGDVGVLPGNSKGDFGRWSLEGTAGPQFEGFNGSPGFGLTITFDAPVTSFSLDVSRANGSPVDSLFDMWGYYRGSFVAQVPQTRLGAINEWSTFTLSGPLDRVVFVVPNADYGIDNVQFTEVPEPSTCSLLALAALSGCVFHRRLRKVPPNKSLQ